LRKVTKIKEKERERERGGRREREGERERVRVRGGRRAVYIRRKLVGNDVVHGQVNL